jgi:hypothetical protein
MTDFEIDQWNDPYPVPTIDVHYGPSQTMTTTLDMRSITTAFQVHEALRDVLGACGDDLTEEEITGLLAEDSPLTITDPQGDCVYFYDAERGKFNMTQWAEFCKYKAPRVEKQAYLRIFRRWNGPHFTSHRIGRFADTNDAINKALEAYQINPDWLIHYLDRPRLMKERLSNEIASEECCWFWRGMQQSDSEWL